MRKYEEGKKILKNDSAGVSFVKNKVRKEIEKDIEECLKKQQKEIDQIVDELNIVIKVKFNSISDFKLFIVNNFWFNTAS
ncbi:hypothetical protein [Aquimarina sp. RZ0]|uniref:hypothetical protein n=1 Tax=Aquimarina sp. RZ0 TaxID=2607730 RepID=UPI0011F3C8A7|nr:hypothetical protein [Aquimarina sp. RZ0]KAA1244498.1 hypothetical protein F0000_16050 [Aquimarina sp. RZ0]